MVYGRPKAVSVILKSFGRGRLRDLPANGYTRGQGTRGELPRGKRRRIAGSLNGHGRVAGHAAHLKRAVGPELDLTLFFGKDRLAAAEARVGRLPRDDDGSFRRRI